MKTATKFSASLIIILIIGCAPNTSKKDYIKARSGDQTMVVLNHIKFGKKDEFNDILFNEVMPAYYVYEDSSIEKTN